MGHTDQCICESVVFDHGCGEIGGKGNQGGVRLLGRAPVFLERLSIFFIKREKK